MHIYLGLFQQFQLLLQILVRDQRIRLIISSFLQYSTSSNSLLLQNILRKTKLLLHKLHPLLNTSIPTLKILLLKFLQKLQSLQLILLTQLVTILLQKLRKYVVKLVLVLLTLQRLLYPHYLLLLQIKILLLKLLQRSLHLLILLRQLQSYRHQVLELLYALSKLYN